MQIINESRKILRIKKILQNIHVVHVRSFACISEQHFTERILFIIRWRDNRAHFLIAIVCIKHSSIFHICKASSHYYVLHDCAICTRMYVLQVYTVAVSTRSLFINLQFQRRERQKQRVFIKAYSISDVHPEVTWIWELAFNPTTHPEKILL